MRQSQTIRFHSLHRDCNVRQFAEVFGQSLALHSLVGDEGRGVLSTRFDVGFSEVAVGFCPRTMVCSVCTTPKLPLLLTRTLPNPDFLVLS